MPRRSSAGVAAEQGIADPDAGVEEAERLAGFQRLQPQGYLCQFGGEVVDVNAVETAAGDFPQGVLDFGRGGLVFAGAELGQSLGDAAGGGDQEVPGATGGIADGERQQPPFGVGPSRRRS